MFENLQDIVNVPISITLAYIIIKLVDVIKKKNSNGKEVNEIQNYRINNLGDELKKISDKIEILTEKIDKVDKKVNEYYLVALQRYNELDKNIAIIKAKFHLVSGKKISSDNNL